MIVKELISHLTNYAAQSPENGFATVMIQSFDDMVYGIAGANDARGMVGEHMLIVVPDLNDKLGVKTFKVQ